MRLRTSNGSFYFVKNRKDILANKFTKSFKDWCIENNQLYLLDLWDYKLNDKTPGDYGVMSAKKCWFKRNRAEIR